MFYIFHSVSALCDIKEGWLPCEIIILKEEQAKKKKKREMKDGFPSGRFTDRKEEPLNLHF